MCDTRFPRPPSALPLLPLLFPLELGVPWDGLFSSGSCVLRPQQLLFCSLVIPSTHTEVSSWLCHCDRTRRLWKQRPVLRGSPRSPPAPGVPLVTRGEPELWHQGRQRMCREGGAGKGEEGDVSLGAECPARSSWSRLLLAEICWVHVGFLTFPHFLPPSLRFE